MKFNVERSITINAPVKKVKELVLDFHKWEKWSPWTIAEPDCPITIIGKPGTAGHEMSWDGEIIGSGKNILINVMDNQLDYDLEFLKPYKSKAAVSFIFKSSKKGTKVTWSMDSSMPFFMFFMIPMMKGWIGMDYDRGLRMLKGVAEKGKVNATTTNKGVSDFEGFSYVGLKRTIAIADVGSAMPKDFDKLIKDVVMTNGKSAKHWVSLYPKMDMRTMQMTYIAAVSDEELSGVELDSEYVRGTIEAGKVFEVFHKGAYDFIGNAWSMGMMYLRAKKIKQKGIPFEYYWNSPKEVAPEKLKTSVYFPLK